MMGSETGILYRYRLALILLAPILVVAALVAFFPPDGNERTQWLQFIGRFHPLTVHLPIAFVLLVPLLELFGRSPHFSYLRSSSGFVLGLATLSATAAATLGWCLGRSGGYSGPLIVQHMWGGVLLAIVCWLCWLLRSEWQEPKPAYATALALAVGLVAWTGYRGGQLSLGANHLTEQMPGALRHLLRVSDNTESDLSKADPHTFYGARVQPIFATRCISCHNADKHKGNLRLDSYQALMRGGKHGPPVHAGNTQNSDLLRRITLPASHDDFMPKGKAPLSADQVKIIELWIAAGASDTLPVEAIRNAPSGSNAAVTEVTFTEIDPTEVAKQRAAIEPAVTQLQKQFPNILDYETRGSADLRLNASLLAVKFGDKDLQAFAPVADHITTADLSRTAITDRSAAILVSMKRLRVLRLTNTSVTDATLQQLGTMDSIESVNVFGTLITPAILPIVAKLPKLAHFYVGETKITPGKSVPESLSGKLVF
jgi:uncharacterized membrane protein